MDHVFPPVPVRLAGVPSARLLRGGSYRGDQTAFDPCCDVGSPEARPIACPMPGLVLDHPSLLRQSAPWPSSEFTVDTLRINFKSGKPVMAK